MNPVSWAALAAWFTFLGIAAWWFPAQAVMGLFFTLATIAVVLMPPRGRP